MVDVTGKTIGELPQVSKLDGDFKFLGCQGPDTSYSTWRVTYTQLSCDLSAAFINSLCADLADKIDQLENYIMVGDGTLYLNKNAPTQQVVSSDTAFDNSVAFRDSVTFTAGANRQSRGDYKGVELPYSSFRAPSNSRAGYSHDNDTRIVTSADVRHALDEFKQAIFPQPEQILDMSYASYAAGGVKVVPSYKNKNYVYDPAGSDPSVFYRYAGIKNPDLASRPPSQIAAAADGAVYRQTRDFKGIPLTKPYGDFSSITVVCALDSAPTSGVNSAKKLCSVTISTAELAVARRYYEYKAKYKRAGSEEKFFGNIADKWYFGSSADGVLYLSLKCNETFQDRFLPLYFSTNGYCVVAVFGQA